MSGTSPLPAEPAAARGIWGMLAYWGLHAWVLGYTFVMLSAFYVQLAEDEFPCPLCMLQRYGMFFSTMGALLVVMQARRGTLTPPLYAQGLGMGILGAVVGGSVSWRQVDLHIMPGDLGYGEAIMGLHLYTWALITFVIVILYCAVMLMLMPRGIPEAPAAGSTPRLVSTVVVWIFLGVVIANVIAIIVLEGFAFVLPDDPNSYNLIDQLTGK